jgi:transmembrane sensor
MNTPDRFDDLSRHLRVHQQDWDTDAAWSQLHTRLQTRRSNRRGWLIAAMLIVALGIGLLTRAWFTSRDPAAQTLQSYSTGVGERQTVHLPDRSSVVLGPTSRLAVIAFDDQQRSVRLTGQAFFEVTRGPNRPFSVATTGARVQVLGTSFDVSAYAGEPVRVAVASGRVAVARAVVTTGQIAIVHDGHVSVSEGNVEAITAWRNGQLAFNNAEFSAVAATLERWHDVDIEIGDSALANSRVSAVFAQQSTGEVIEVLAETLGARVTRAGRRITFQTK